MTDQDKVKALAQEIAADVWDRPSIETREEFVSALSAALQRVAAPAPKGPAPEIRHREGCSTGKPCDLCTPPSVTPGMTDLMVTPESIPAYLEANPPDPPAAPPRYNAANLSSAMCAGCSHVNSPDGSVDGYFILDARGINYPWHKVCAAKALAASPAAVLEVPEKDETETTSGRYSNWFSATTCSSNASPRRGATFLTSKRPRDGPRRSTLR